MFPSLLFFLLLSLDCCCRSPLFWPLLIHHHQLHEKMKMIWLFVCVHAAALENQHCAAGPCNCKK
jgi:hypothetical protein